MSQLPSRPGLLDCHIHYGSPAFRQGLISILAQEGVQKFNIVCTPHRTRLSLVPDALHLKALHPQSAYIFGGLDISPLFMDPANCGAHFAGYLDTLVKMGCDGVKMIEGKPDMRKTLPIPPFDSPAYIPYWEKLASMGLPLLFHVNDPEEFWDPLRIPDWARQRGWFYGDGSFIDYETQYSEVLNVLRRHPQLKVIFAHFFFLSADLKRLAGYLEEFPNMHIDLTPGIEMYANFGCNLAAARDFFIKFQDRILFGTDIGSKALLATPEAGIEPEESHARVSLVRRFLEGEGPFLPDSDKGYLFGRFDRPLQGIYLPDEILEKIYRLNFEKLAGEKPRRLDRAAILQECQRLAAIIPILGANGPTQPGDTSVVEMVSSYFAQEYAG